MPFWALILTKELLKESYKENWTGEQSASLVDDFLGDVWMDNVRQGLDYMKEENREQYDLEIQQAQVTIRNAHPYWGQIAPPGKRTSISDDQQQEEVERWMTDENLEGRPVVEAARIYLAERDAYIRMLEAESMTLSGEYQDDWKMQVAISVRSELRKLAERLTEETPEFDALWKSVYASEISQTNDGWDPDYTEFYGEDLFETTIGLGPDVEKQFSTTFAGASKSGGGGGGGWRGV